MGKDRQLGLTIPMLHFSNETRAREWETKKIAISFINLLLNKFSIFNDAYELRSVWAYVIVVKCGGRESTIFLAFQ